MSEKSTQPIEACVRHQSGPSSLLTFHLNPAQRLQMIEALASGREIEIPVQLELSVLPQWVTNPGDALPHAVIPIGLISFNVDSTR